jgi:hypothetical protein
VIRIAITEAEANERSMRTVWLDEVWVDRLGVAGDDANRVLRRRLPAREPLVPILPTDLMERRQSQIDLLGGVGYI